MSDSEEDYMSDTFLVKCQDTRPGLVSNKVSKQHNKEAKIKECQKRNQMKPLKVIEHEKRTEGLNQAIGEDNKGFLLMKKMGFKPGMVLGKKGTGRAEPVPINLRTGRGGLGEDTERKRKKAEVASMRFAMMQKRKKREAVAHRDFRAENSRKMQEKRDASDLYKSQRVCEQLDEQEGHQEPEFIYFWTPTKIKILLKQAESDEDSDDDLNQVDMDTKRKDHPSNLPPSNEDEEFNLLSRLQEEEEEEEEEDEDVIDVKQLQTLTHYLRTTYLYCVWCGTKYDDCEDLSQNCPGDSAEAHDS